MSNFVRLTCTEEFFERTEATVIFIRKDLITSFKRAGKSEFDHPDDPPVFHTNVFHYDKCGSEECTEVDQTPDEIIALMET